MKNFSILIILLSAVLLPVIVKAQEGLSVSLLVDNEKQKTVFQNEPVLFTITVSNTSIQSDKLWNISADRRLRELEVLVRENKIKKEDADKERDEISKNKRRSDAITAGSSSSPWAEQLKWELRNKQTKQIAAADIKLMAYPSTAAILKLDAVHTMAVAMFGISPADVQKIIPGKYEISVSLNDASDNITLEVKRELLKEPELNEAMLFQYGSYYLHEGDAAKAIQYADRMLVKNPASLDGLSLKADAQVMAGSFLPALETYNEAVKQYYKQNGANAEPPGYLLSMIGVMKERLGDIKQ